MNSNIDLIEMFHVGCGFSDCADFCLKTEVSPSEFMLHITPAVVNVAFACEVFLKLLLLFEKVEFKKEHRLEELFQKLPGNLKEELKICTIAKYGKWEDSFGRQYISLVSDAFREWRYIYENDWSKSAVKHIDVGFLMAFRDSLQELCRSRMEQR